MSHTNMINEKKKALLAYKEKIQDEIKYYEKAIDDFRVNYKNNSFYDDSDSSDSEDEFPFAVDTGPSVSELKLKQALLKTCLHATQELTSLTVLQSEVELLVEEPKIEGEPPITEPGTWKEVTAECNIDLVPFTITFYMHTPNYKFAPTSYRGLKVVPVKGSHELELSKSVLHSLKVPSDAVEVLRSYADGYRSRRTTLARLANKYANSLFMEPHPEGGFILKCAGLLEVSWRLENKWSPVAPFHHKMKFDLEYMEESYIKIITQAHKQLLDPAIQTDERTLLLAKIITTCLEARGPVEDSDLESKTTEKDIELEKRDSEVMAPPKSLPKKGKQKNKDNMSVKRSLVDDDKGATAKKAKHDEVATAKMAKTDEAPTGRKAEVATAKKAKHDEVPTGKKAKTDEVATAKKAQSNEVTTSKKVKNDNQNDVAKKIQTDIAKTAKVSDVANEGSKKRKVIDVVKVAGAKNDGDDQNIDDEAVKKRKVNDDKLASTKNSKESVVTKESNAKTDSNNPKNNNTGPKNTNSNVKNNKNAKDSEKNEAAITKNKNIKTIVNNNDKNANTNDNKTKTTKPIAKNTENKTQDNAKPKNVKEINSTEPKTAKTNVKNKSPIDSANKDDKNNKMDIVNDAKEVNSKTKTKNLKEQMAIDDNVTAKPKNSKEIANTDLKSLKSKVNTQNVDANTIKDHETKSKVTKDKNNENEVKKNSKPKADLKTDKNQEINKNSDNVDKKKAKNVTDVKNKENLNVNRNTFTIANTENGEKISTNNLKDKTFTKNAEKVTKNDKNPTKNIEINEKPTKTDSKDKTSTKNAEKMSKTDKVSAKNIDKTAKNDIKHKTNDIQDKKTKNATQTKNDVQKITTAVENKIEKLKSKQNPLQKSDKINSKTTKINNIITVTEKNANNFNTKDKISHINPTIKNKNILPTKNNKNSIASNKISKPSIASHRTSLKKSLSTGNTQVLTAGNTEAGKISKIPQKKFSPISEGSSKKNMLRISPRINPSKFKMLSQDVKQKLIKTTNIPRLLKKPVGKV